MSSSGDARADADTLALFARKVSGDVRAILSQVESDAGLNEALRLLSKWRSYLVQTVLIQECGTRVLGGVFKDMDFISQSAEGCHIAKLLGSYEQPIHRYVEEAINTPYELVINIGCAEGYYAVGLARRMPQAKILAFDLGETARLTCASLAARNGVMGRVEIGERFSVSDFETYAGRRALVVCDIEGAERELLDPVAAPALLGFDLIVESHDCMIPGLAKMLGDRFRATHDVLTVLDTGARAVPAPPPWFVRLSHMDQLLAVWEWRSGATPWLIMKRRKSG